MGHHQCLQSNLFSFPQLFASFPIIFPLPHFFLSVLLRGEHIVLRAALVALQLPHHVGAVAAVMVELHVLEDGLPLHEQLIGALWGSEFAVAEGFEMDGVLLFAHLFCLFWD